MRSEQEGFVSGIASGRVPAIAAHRIEEEFRQETVMCVYDCGRKAMPGKDCCKECYEEAFTPLKFLAHSHR